VRHRVLVPLDGSKLAEAILPVAIGLRPTEIVLVRVVASDAEGNEARAYVAECAGRLGASCPVSSVVRVGRPADLILESASSGGAGLIALTTAGRSGFERLVMGSVAEKIIRSASLPILALRAAEDAAPVAPDRLFDRVLVPYDGSERAWHAVATLGLLAAGEDAHATLYGVVSADEAPHDPQLRGSQIEQILTLEADALRAQLEQAASRVRGLGLRAAVDVAVGPVPERIVTRAESMGATLVAMSTHGRTGLMRWALGSVTELVLRAATMPLLICR
jgi:nucleotide-binding universal stress UspA family protein